MLGATQKGQATTIKGRLNLRQVNYDPEYPSIRFEIFEGVIKTPHVPKYNFPMVVLLTKTQTITQSLLNN